MSMCGLMKNMTAVAPAWKNLNAAKAASALPEYSAPKVAYN